MVLPPSPTFVCGVAKPQRRVQTCPPQDDRRTRRNLERFSTEPSISHHKYSLNISSELTQRTDLHSRSACKSRDPNVTLRDVVSAKSACVCRDKKFIGVRDFRERDEEDQKHNEVSMNTLMLSAFEVVLKVFLIFTERTQRDCILFTITNLFCEEVLDYLEGLDGGTGISAIS